MSDKMSDKKSAHVLVVDDEPYIRELLCDALNRTGVKVTAAASGKEAADLASVNKPDLLITDLRLADCDGTEVVDTLRRIAGNDIPTVVITGQSDSETLTNASRCRPIELMTKPLNIERLQATIREELARRSETDRLRSHAKRLRHVARKINRQRKNIHNELNTRCKNLASAYRTLSGQFAIQEIALAFQRELLAAREDDDVFRSLFSLFVHQSGPLFGAAMVCDAEAQLKIVGRFGVPNPDSLAFCEAICEPIVNATLGNPQCLLIDAGEEAEVFSESIRKYLVGLTVLGIPLIPAPGEMIGLVVLYRKGEQPFIDSDVALAEMIATPTAIAVRRND